jgi:serine/threonine-protein kinase
MTPERWQRIKPLLQSALERDPDQRSAFLIAECGGDEALRQEVQSLIISNEQAGKFIESPAVEVMAGSLGDDQVVGSNLGPYAITARLGAGGMLR